MCVCGSGPIPPNDRVCRVQLAELGNNAPGQVVFDRDRAGSTNIGMRGVTLCAICSVNNIITGYPWVPGMRWPDDGGGDGNGSGGGGGGGGAMETVMMTSPSSLCSTYACVESQHVSHTDFKRSRCALADHRDNCACAAGRQGRLRPLPLSHNLWNDADLGGL
jgi:hypothetical protein